MGTLGNPKIWVPYINPNDCSQGFCSLSCPQWCYRLIPPPPPLFSITFNTSSSSSGPTFFSPLVITIIGVLAGAFLLVSYYMILSRYCGNSEPSRRVEDNQSGSIDDEEEEERGERENPSEHEAWVIRTVGLDEALIKSITLVKYKKGDGLVGSGDCSVCLGEFQEDESLRLLPKCSHAFHVECIDTWLRSHSNCPLCRASLSSATSRPPNFVVDNSNNHHHQPLQDQEPSIQTQVQNEEIRSCDQEGASRVNLPKCPSRVLSDLGPLGGVLEGLIMRRSISMGHFYETRLSISDHLRFDSKEATAGESSMSRDRDGGSSSSSSSNGVFHSVMNSMAMKRSVSSGRFLFAKHGRGRNAVIPL